MVDHNVIPLRSDNSDERRTAQLRYAKRIREIFPGIGVLAVIEFAGCLMHYEPALIDEILDDARDDIGHDPFTSEHSLYLMARHCMNLSAIKPFLYSPTVHARSLQDVIDEIDNA